MAVHHARPHVRQRAAQDDRASVEGMYERGDRRLGHAVGVQQRGTIPNGGTPAFHQADIDRLAAHDDEPKGLRYAGAGPVYGRRPFVPVPGGEIRHADLLAGQQVLQFGDPGNMVSRNGNDTATAHQGREDLLGRNVEDRRRELQDPIGRPKARGPGEPQAVVRQAAMADPDALRIARGAGGEHQVGKRIEVTADVAAVRRRPPPIASPQIGE